MGSGHPLRERPKRRHRHVGMAAHGHIIAKAGAVILQRLAVNLQAHGMRLAATVP
jgi:hypothetical protein